MTETRDELVEEVEGFLLEMWEKGRCDEPFTLSLASDQIIALVTEHRDAEIREALLSDGALVVVENARFFDENSRELVMRQIRHIGLHGDETGGQG